MIKNRQRASVFILGASILQVPAIKKAKERGLFVYVLDYDPSAIGIPYADEYLNISTIDKEAVYEAALRLKPDYIITSTSDMPVRTVSWVCEKLGKKTDISYEGAICATDKVAMRNRLKACGVPIPYYYEIACIDDYIKYVELMPKKFILKPADNSASRGVVLVAKDEENQDLKSLYDYCLSYSRSGVVLIEEYMEGPEVSVEAYSVDGEPHIITITDKIVTREPFFVELGHTEPSRLSMKQQKDIYNVSLAAIKAIGMQNGPTHTELKVTPNGVKVVEIAARLGGDFITSKLVPLSTGVDMIECSFASLFGLKPECDSTLSRGAAIRYIQADEGVVKGIAGLEKARNIPGIHEIEVYVKIGDHVNTIKNSSDRIGHVIAVGKDANEAEEIAEKAIKMIKIDIDQN